tara:strand:- start:56 stop:1315 length:1260 start_codon:yes stop_codon:yes gene_type:complete
MLHVSSVKTGFGAETLALQTTIDNTTMDYNITNSWNYGTDVRHALCLQPYKGYVGIGTTSPSYPLHIFTSTGASHYLEIENTRNTGGASVGVVLQGPTNNWMTRYLYTTNEYLRFMYNGSTKSYVDTDSNGGQINFTAQHRTFIDGVTYQDAEDYVGLVVSSKRNKYIKMDGGVETGSNAITINESLPIVTLSNVAHDKACFGVISAGEDPEQRTDRIGSLVALYDKEDGDTRIYINSGGEGAMWVTNINGPLESGDYITTSNVAGYGMKQDSEFLANYTVAKITMDCDFSPATQPVQIIKKELGNVNYWVETTYTDVEFEEYSNLTEENRRTVTDSEIVTYQKIDRVESTDEQEGYTLEVREELVNVLDEHGQLQWEDHPTETEQAYKIRYLTGDGTQTDEANAVHIAAFVGCTYHCG